MYLTRLFLAVVLMMFFSAPYPSTAAPTVKQLGGTTINNALSKTNQESVTKSATASMPSVRALGLSTKPATNATNATATKTTGTSDSVRLSGLHGNLVKGIGSKLSSNLSSQPGGGGAVTSDLTQRVINLETEMANKQGILEPGEGIYIDGNTISLSDEILALSEQMEEIAQELDDLNDQFGTDNYYTIGETEEYFKENYYTKEDIDAVINRFTKMNIADHFDPGILTVQP